MSEYRRSLSEWERERDRQMYEFTITEKNLIPKREKITQNNRKRSSNNSRVIAQLNSTASSVSREVEISKQQLASSTDQRTYKPYRVRG